MRSKPKSSAVSKNAARPTLRSRLRTPLVLTGLVIACTACDALMVPPEVPVTLALENDTAVDVILQTGTDTALEDWVRIYDGETRIRPSDTCALCDCATPGMCAICGMAPPEVETLAAGAGVTFDWNGQQWVDDGNCESAVAPSSALTFEACWATDVDGEDAGRIDADTEACARVFFTLGEDDAVTVRVSDAL
jgi:hypothetical protein